MLEFTTNHVIKLRHHCVLHLHLISNTPPVDFNLHQLLQLLFGACFRCITAIGLYMSLLVLMKSLTCNLSGVVFMLFGAKYRFISFVSQFIWTLCCILLIWEMHANIHILPHVPSCLFIKQVSVWLLCKKPNRSPYLKWPRYFLTEPQS